MNVEPHDDLIQRYAEIVRLGQIGSILLWDQNTYMPPGAAEMRGEQQSLVSGIAHKRLTSKKMGRLLDRLKREELTPEKTAIVREIERKHERASSIPRSLIQALSRLEPLSTGAWIKARKKEDFSFFKKEFKEVIELKKKVAEHVGYEDTPYDALLDEYEPYMKSRKLTDIFLSLGEKLKPLVTRLTEVCGDLGDGKMKGKYPIDSQREYLHYLLIEMGYDMETGRIDISEHPFTAGNHDDVRITLRYDEKDLRTALFSAIHEGGHALYEQGFKRKNYFTPLAEYVSLGIHESQSRMYENIIGRSRSFWEWQYPILKEKFPSLKKMSLDEFHRLINHITQSPIRVEADEVTYSLHIVIRFMIEKDLMEDKLSVDEVPQVWNELYGKYLDLEPESESLGCLQDIHWSMGAIGYFPTYTLGNLYSAQFFKQAQKDIDYLESSIARGDLKTILNWLRENIHMHGKFYSAPNLVEKVTGKPLSEDHFIDYLRKKYSSIYDISL